MFSWKAFIMNTKDYILVAVLTALLCVIAPISIPLSGGVPISLASFMIMLIGVLLKDVKATLVVILYILLAIFGLPVLAGYLSGVDRVFGITGGFILGYIPLAFICGLFSRLSMNYDNKKRTIYLILGMVLGTIVLYVVGVLWFINFTKLDLAYALGVCVLPFILGDIIKIVLVLIISPRLLSSIKE